MDTTPDDWRNWTPRRTAAQATLEASAENAAAAYALIYVGDQLGRIADALAADEPRRPQQPTADGHPRCPSIATIGQEARRCELADGHRGRHQTTAAGGASWDDSTLEPRPPSPYA